LLALFPQARAVIAKIATVHEEKEGFDVTGEEDGSLQLEEFLIHPS
jgi:hypothetical protein